VKFCPSLEVLESRVLLDAASGMYAEGTPLAVIEAMESQLANTDGDIEFFRLSSRWTSTATNPGPLAQGQATTITWSIVPDGTPIPGFGGEPAAPSNLRAFMDGIYGSAALPLASKPWVQLIDGVFARWSQLAGLTYVYEANDDGGTFSNIPTVNGGVLGVRGDVRIGGHFIDGNSGTLAYNFFPNTGDMVIDTGDNTYTNTTGTSLRLRNIVAHEHGHGLGFSHLESASDQFLMEPFLATTFDGPQLDDILAAQRGYGDVFEKLGGNDTTATATDLGIINAGSTVTRGTLGSASVVAATGIDFLSIDDVSDTDFFRFTVAADRVATVTLVPQGLTYQEGPQGGPEAPLNTRTLSDLSLQILGTDGVSILGTANTQPAGSNEVLTNIPLLSAGTYYVRVTGAATNVQMYQLSVQVVLGGGITITESGGSTSVAEGGGSDTYTVVLNTAPTANVTVAINPGAQLAVSPPGPLTFTTANWNTPQTITVTAIDDSAVESVHSGTISHLTSSTDTNYSGKTGSLTVSITDNDFGPGIRITETSGSTSVTEGGATDTYMVSLNTVPTANVTVTINPGTQVDVLPTTLVFTPTNWNVPRTVTVTAEDDDLLEGLHTGSVLHTATSADTDYNGKTATLVVNIVDNEIPPKGVTITETSGSTNVVEGGATDTYRVVLRTMPTATVTITVTGGTQVTVSPATLNFTAANWSNPQTVTVTAVNDAILEGTHSYYITHTAVSTDTDYNAVGITSVVAIISDNDTPTPLRVFRPLRYSRDRETTNVYVGNITVNNLSTAAGSGPLYAVLRNLPSDVIALGTTGTTTKGSPYYRLPGTANLPASTTLRIPIRLQNNSNQALGTYLQGFTIEITGVINDSGAADPSGYVYVDANKNGYRDAGEAGIPDVLIELTGVTADGQQVYDSMRTDADGFYNFIVLPGTYAVRQTQPAGYRDGQESLGTLGGTIENDRFSNIHVRPGENGVEYNFGEWINHAPLLQTEDFTAHAGQDLAFMLLASDEETYDPLTYSVHLADRSDLAHELQRELGLVAAKKYSMNKLKLGLDEIWITGAGKKKYLLLPDGELYLYSGKRGPLETHTLVGTLNSNYYANPNLLTTAAAPIAAFTVVDNHVTLSPRAGFAGVVDIIASVHDGVAGTSASFRATLTNSGPTLGTIADVQIPAGSAFATVDLAAHDADDDLLAWAYQLTGGDRLAYELKVQLGLRPTSNYSMNTMGYGYQEKWLTGSNKQKYFLLPTGELYRYGGRRGPLTSHTLVDTLGPEFYVDPRLLWGASEPTVTLQIVDNQLRITPRTGYQGTFTVAVSVTDGIDSVSRSFSVQVS